MIMNTRGTATRSLTIIVLSSALMACRNDPPSAFGPIGFGEAVFDKASLETLMQLKNAEFLRFYNVRRTASDVNGTAMVIAIPAAEGTEIKESLTGYKYRMYDKLLNGRVVLINHNKTAAAQACRFVLNAKDSSYVTEFKVQDIMELLHSTSECNALLVQAIPWREGYFTMKLQAVRVTGNRYALVGTSAPLSCTEPCPNFCGPPTNYVNQ